MNNSKIWTKDFILSCLGCFFLFVNFYMLLSSMPLAIKQNMAGSPKDMSLVVSIYILGVVLLRPFSGIISDQIGARRVTLITQLLFVVCTLLYLGISGILPLLILRLIHGIFHSLATTSHAAMGINLVPSSRKGEGVGYYGLAMSLSMVLGPALGLYILNSLGYNYLIGVAGFFSIMSWIFTLMTKKSTEFLEIETKKAKAKKSFMFSNFVEPKAIPVCLSALVFSFSYSSLISFMAVYTSSLGNAQAAMYFFIFFAISILVTRPIIGKLLDRKGPSFLMFPSLLIFILGLILLGTSHSVFQIILSSLFLGISYGAIFPSFQTIAIRLSPADKAGSAMATFFLFYDAGFGLGAFLLAMVASLTGYAMMYMLVSLLVLLTIFLYYFLYHRKHPHGKFA